MSPVRVTHSNVIEKESYLSKSQDLQSFVTAEVSVYDFDVGSVCFVDQHHNDQSKRSKTGFPTVVETEKGHPVPIFRRARDGLTYKIS